MPLAAVVPMGNCWTHRDLVRTVLAMKQHLGAVLFMLVYLCVQRIVRKTRHA